MGYQTVRALRPIQHDKVMRIPGQTTGVNAQDFVVSDSQAAVLVALGAVTAQGAAAAPGSTRSPVVFRTFADVTALNAYLTSSGQTAVNGDTAYLGADDASAEPWDLVASVWTKRGSGSASSTPVKTTSSLPSAMRNASRPLRVHVYGNSLDQEDRFWRTVAAVSGGALVIIKNSAVGGITGDQVLANMIAGGFDDAADIVAFGEGTNDGKDTAVPLRSTQDCINSLAACVDLVLAAGKLPLLRLPPPTDNAWNAQVLKNWLALIFMAEKKGVYAWDAYAKYADTDGTWVAGFSSDNVHPTAPNYSVAAAEGFAMLTSYAKPMLLPRSNAGQGMIGSNVLQLTDSNSDGLADGWSPLGLTGHTINAATNYSYPFRGKKNSIAISQSANGSIYKELSTGYSVGERIRLTGIFGCSNLSNCNAVVYLRAVGPTVDQYAVYTSNTLTDQYVSTELVVPSGTTSIQLWIRTLLTTGGAYTATIEFGAFDLYNVSRNTLI